VARSVEVAVVQQGRLRHRSDLAADVNGGSDERVDHRYGVSDQTAVIVTGDTKRRHL
jgi:hypothetical protein